MENIKRFFWDESASAEATSTVLLIGAVSIMLGAGLIAWWTPVKAFFTGASAGVTSITTPASTGISNLATGS